MGGRHLLRRIDCGRSTVCKAECVLKPPQYVLCFHICLLELPWLEYRRKVHSFYKLREDNVAARLNAIAWQSQSQSQSSALLLLLVECSAVLLRSLSPLPWQYGSCDAQHCPAVVQAPLANCGQQRFRSSLSTDSAWAITGDGGDSDAVSVSFSRFASASLSLSADPDRQAVVCAGRPFLQPCLQTVCHGSSSALTAFSSWASRSLAAVAASLWCA